MKTPNDLQRYLMHYKSYDKLTEDFGIKCVAHPTLPLTLVKYDQIESPRFHPIVIQSRGTVLENGSYKIVGQGFLRFYNLGETWEQADNFKWDNFTCTEKVDGSLVNLWNYKGTWNISLSGTFGFQDISPLIPGKSWIDFFFETLFRSDGHEYDNSEFTGMDSLNEYLNPNYTYIFELCSLYNKIVREYRIPRIFLLGVYNTQYDPYELNHYMVDAEAYSFGFRRPESYNFKSLSNIEEFLKVKEATDKTYEGVVARDINNIRFKIKSKMYLTLAHIHDNGNISAPKHILPWILKGDKEELLSYFNEFRSIANEMEDRVNTEFETLNQVWKEAYTIESQKDFALHIVPKTKFSGILFDIRKKDGRVYSEEALRDKWNNSQDLILKVLYKD